MKYDTNQLTPHGAPLGFWKGALDMLPLSFAVIPWGILAGSVAINTGLSVMQALGMSVLVFAGAAQLVSLSMLSAGASILSIVLTIFFLTSQHFIYALQLRHHALKLPLFKRVLLGFLLTDELYATAMLREPDYSYRYLIGAGFSFYVSWVAFSTVGIYLARIVPDLSALHLDFSIVVIFIVMAILVMKDHLAIIGMTISALLAVCFSWLKFDAAILAAGMIGMAITAMLDIKRSKS